MHDRGVDRGGVRGDGEGMRALLTFVFALASGLILQAADPIVLKARDAMVAGPEAKYESGGARDCIGFIHSTNVTITWKFDLPQRGAYRVFVLYSTGPKLGGGAFEVTAGGQRADGSPVDTGDWGNFKELDLGPILLRKPGPTELVVRPTRLVNNRHVMNLRSVKLVPEF